MYYLVVSFFLLTFFFFKLKYSYNVVLVSGKQNIYSFPYHLLQDVNIVPRALQLDLVGYVFYI